MSNRTLILGLGNDLLRDDGVGLVAARRVAALAGGAADLAEAGVATIDLLPLIRGYDRLVVIDAYVSDDDPPGTAVRATPADLPSGFGYRSFHTLPFDEMLELGRRIGLPMPRDVTIHGLSVAEVSTFGRRFTRPVARSWRAWADSIARAEFCRPAGERWLRSVARRAGSPGGVTSGPLSPDRRRSRKEPTETAGDAPPYRTG